MAVPFDIEWIVEEVVRRIGSHADTAEPNGGRRELRDHRVISLAQLDGQLDGITQLALSSCSIITPAAQDLLRQRGINVVRVRPTQANGHHQFHVAIGTAETKHDPTAMVRKLTDQGIQVQQLARSGLTVVVQELVDLVGRGGCGGMLLTENTTPALCMANRHRGVRAGLGVDLSSVKEVIRSVGANLLVMNPHATGPNLQWQMALEFCRAGDRLCPPEYANALG